LNGLDAYLASGLRNDGGEKLQLNYIEIELTRACFLWKVVKEMRPSMSINAWPDIMRGLLLYLSGTNSVYYKTKESISVGNLKYSLSGSYTR